MQAARQLAGRHDGRDEARSLQARRPLPLADQPRQEHPRRRPLHAVPGLRPRRRRQGRGRLQDGRRHDRRRGRRRSATPARITATPSGFILDGPEFLTVFEGATGKALATTAYIPPRGQGGRLGRQPRQPGRPLPRGRRVPRRVAAERGHVPRLLHEDGARRLELAGRLALARLDLRQRRRHPRQPGLPRPGEPQPRASATSTATARTRSSTGPARSTTTARGSTRRAWGTATPSTSPTSIRTAPAWRSSTSTNARATPTAPSSATRGPAP